MAVALAYVEMARMALQLYFSLAEKTGKTAEEQAKMFDEELAKFNERSPEDLPEIG